MEKLGKLRSELVGLRTSKVSSAPQVKLARIKVRNITISYDDIVQIVFVQNASREFSNGSLV